MHKFNLWSATLRNCSRDNKVYLYNRANISLHAILTREWNDMAANVQSKLTAETVSATTLPFSFREYELECDVLSITQKDQTTLGMEMATEWDMALRCTECPL